MARIRDEHDGSRWSRLQRWLSEGDDPLDRDLIEAVDAPTPLPDAVPPVQPLKLWKVREEARRSHRIEKADRFLRLVYVLSAVLVCAGIIGVLWLTTERLPSFGGVENPANNEVPAHYIEKGMEETGAVNIVAGMILDYRAFDTLGESNVLFVAACTVIILMRIRSGDPADRLAEDAGDGRYEPGEDSVLQVMAALIVPLVLVFGVYIVLNGHLSPGGGFSGGAVMGAALILYLNAYGSAKAGRFFTFRTFRAVSLVALSFYALSKAYSFFTGANGLSSVITAGTPGRIFSAGLIPYLNIAVGLVVCCTMYALYTLFRKGDL